MTRLARYGPAVWALSALVQAAEPPVVIRRGEPQLFVDDRLIATQSGLVRTLHQPVKDKGGTEPVIALPGKETLLAKGTIVYDPRLERWVMFAKARPETDIYRFTSPDGLDWTGDFDDGKPIPVFIDRRHPVTGRVEGYGGMHCFHYDVRDGEYPYKGWAFFGNWGDEHEAVYALRSTDGVRWERVAKIMEGYAGPGDSSCLTVRQDGRVVFGPGDTTRFAYDPVGDRFLGIFKFFTTEKVGPGNNLRSRAYAFVDGLDVPFDVKRIRRVDLIPPAAKRGGDEPFDEYYASSAWRYGSVWLGGLQVWHRGGDYAYSSAGCAFLKLLVSRDGLDWSKVPFDNDAGIPEVFLASGPEGGNGGRNDGGYMSEFSQGPLRIGDELVYYYGATSYGKNHPPKIRISGGGVFRARLRLDGFVSVDAGTLTTVALRPEGRDLRVNAVGPIAIDLLDQADAVVGRARVTGDSLRHEIEFGGRSLGDLAPGRAIRLRFTVRPGGALYSFTVE